MTPEYAAFLASKSAKAPERGLAHMPDLASHLFPFQRASVEHALRIGTAALFLDTGLGKTECQLEWCQKALEATNGCALIITPLAVAAQTKRRAERWGYEARIIRDQSEVGPGINICNYDRLDRLDPSRFGAVSLDEASILKSFGGKTTQALTAAFKDTRFKLCATATPAPNDHMELGNYAAFLEIMSSNEMLSRWFINDTSTASQEWRLKGHAERDFWDWLASWSRMASLPSDITGNPADDVGFVLPPVEIKEHYAATSDLSHLGDGLFGTVALSATNLHDVKRETIAARAEVAASIVASDPSEPRILWIDTDYEADAVKRTIPSAIEIRGSMPVEQKEEILAAFETGEIKHLIGKPAMLGYGLDWSHCARMTFVGRSYSYETFYQAVRRCWRFGQKRTVVVDLVLAEGEDVIARTVDRKAADHDKMKIAMREAMARAMNRDGSADRMVAYNPTYKGRLPKWLSAA